MTITKQSDRSFQVQIRNRTENFTLFGVTLTSVNSQPVIAGTIILNPTVRNLLDGMRNGEKITIN